MADRSTIEVSRTGHCGWCFVCKLVGISVVVVVFISVQFTRFAHFGRTHQQKAIIASRLIIISIVWPFGAAAVTRALKMLRSFSSWKVHSTSPFILSLTLSHSHVITIKTFYFFLQISIFVAVVVVCIEFRFECGALLASNLELKRTEHQIYRGATICIACKECNIKSSLSSL